MSAHYETRGNIPVPRFLGLIARGLAIGVLTAAALLMGAVTLEPIVLSGDLAGLPNALGAGIYAFAITGVLGLILAIFPTAPLTFVFARLMYRRGRHAQRDYALLGAAIGMLGPLALGLFLIATDGVSSLADAFSLGGILIILWFALSGASGGAAFARALQRAEGRLNYRDIF